MSFTPLLICHYVCLCVCVCVCVHVFFVSRCLFVRIAEAQNDPCSLGNMPFQTRDLVHYLYHYVEQEHRESEHYTPEGQASP